jgi:hypothetical protein
VPIATEFTVRVATTRFILTMYSSDPRSPDYVEDYDFFEVKRKERLHAINHQKKEIDAQQRIELKKRALHWRANGTKALEGLKLGITGVRFLLEPHHNMKKTVALYEQRVESMEFETSAVRHTRHSFPLANRVLCCCTSAGARDRWRANKANLIVWKLGVMQEIRAAYIQKHPLNFEYHSRPGDARVMRHLFRTYMLNVPIEHSISEELKKKRALYKVVCAKLKLIHDTQRACALIPLCKSRQHTNPNGCSSCGVKYIGGMLGGGTPYIESASRDTGLVTLVTLEFELQTLEKEDAVQREIVDQVGMDLQAFEDVVCGVVRVSIQVWWSFVLVWKRFKRKQARMDRSLFQYKRRRLIAMKKDIDVTIKEAAPLDMQRYHEVYFDIWPETQEYAALQTDLKRQRLIKWAQRFRRKLGVLVEEARERQYQEYLRLLALPKPPRPIVFRTIQKVDNTNLVCYRLECKMRKFLTKERFDIHMNTHAKQDQVRYERYERDKAARKVRDTREKIVLGRIVDSKLRIEHTPSDYTAHAQDSRKQRAGSTDADSVATDASGDDFTVGSSVRLQEMSQVTLPSAIGGLLSDGIQGPNTVGDGGGEEEQDSESASVVPATRGTGYAARKELRTAYSPDSSLLSGDLQGVSYRGDMVPMGGLSQTLRNNSLAAADRTLSKATRLVVVNSETSLRDSEDAEMNLESAQNVHDWASMAHIYALHSLINDSMYSLELVSKQGDIEVAQRVPLDRPLVRIGTHSTCECVVSPTGVAKRESKVAKVHCLLFCPTYSGGTGPARQQRTSSQLLLVDNSTVWGTYVVSAAGTRKVPTKATAGMPLTPGLLICIGVCKDGPAEISATDANQACVVYRVRCMEQEAV